MKKLKKLQIDSEKLMKNEELIALRGGYGSGMDCCLCIGLGHYIGATPYTCANLCLEIGAPGVWQCII